MSVSLVFRTCHLRRRARWRLSTLHTRMDEPWYPMSDTVCDPLPSLLCFVEYCLKQSLDSEDEEEVEDMGMSGVGGGAG